MTADKLIGNITCPECGDSHREEMPTNACQFFYDFRHACGKMLRPLSGNCCLFLRRYAVSAKAKLPLRKV
ncbi:MAG: GDCCVxC domain-containing (seleno)protein [Candidatus Zeuxoniibacter abyssi]|nr:MAG: GDCCVxC domain-containing (seleno)protein [Candidatus Persebacteraceae bacterium AB1(2)]